MLVRVEGVGPSSHPWEGYIIAVIRYPRFYLTKRLSYVEPMAGVEPVTCSLRMSCSTS